MADSIVACPGCRKQYTVPGGVPPGQFQCQDCAAVVVYGQSDGGAAVSSKGSGGKRKKASRGRKEKEPEERAPGRARGGAPKKEGDPTPYILGIVAIAIVILLVVLLDKDEAPAVAPVEAASGNGGTGATLRSGDFDGTAPEKPPKPVEKPVNPLLGDPADLPATRPAEEDPDALGPGARVRKKPDPKEDSKYEVVANPPTGGNYGKDSDELRSMIRSNRASVVAELPHLPDTAPALASEIDALVLKVSDPYSGREARDASRRLIEIGRAAIPRLLSAAAAQDFSKFSNMMEARDPCVVADAVDDALREITSKTNITKLQFNPQGTLAVYPRVIDNWFVWWLNSGYDRASFPKKAAAAEEEE